MLLALTALARATPLADCPQTWDASALGDVVQSADLSIGKGDTAGVLAMRDLLLVRLGCVSEPLSGPAIGAVHRIVATAALLDGQDPRVAPALGGLLAADPGYQLPRELYPDDSPVRALLPHAALLARDTATRPLATMPSGWLEVDGIAATAVSTVRPAVIQQLGGDGGVVETRYVWPEDELGAWSATASPTVATARPPEKPTRSGHRARLPLAVATAGGAVATGILYGVARVPYGAFTDPEVDHSYEELADLRSQANTATIAWAAAGVATLGLGVGLVLAW